MTGLSVVVVAAAGTGAVVVVIVVAVAVVARTGVAMRRQLVAVVGARRDDADAR